MKKVRYYIALWAAKSAQLLMKFLGRNATYLPGKIAIKICKDFLAHIKPPKTVIAVTGTNGKTTTSNLINSVLTANGYSITNNSLGSNVQAGVISALVEDTTLLGRPKKDIAVLEVDERSSLLIYPHLKPDYLICNNIMRDSIKRNAHTEFISYIINKELPANTKLILNADDFIACRLGSAGQEKVFFGLSAEKPETVTRQHLRDIVYCPECGGTLEAEYIRYNHIGRQYCTKCGLRSPDPDYVVTAIDRENSTFTIEHHGSKETYPLIHDNIVNVYNFCGVISLLHEFGLSYEQISKGFSQAEVVKSRFDSFECGDQKITMIMAKGQNPIACARCYAYTASCPGENKGVIVIADDVADNIKNSESTCWLYDCDFSAFADPSIHQLIFGGPRCKDNYLRALLAGVDPSKMSITEDCVKTADMLDTDVCKDIYLLYEMFRPNEANAIKRKLQERAKGGSRE